MQQKSTWVLVCDASRAKLMEQRPNTEGYSVLKEFDHPGSRARVSEIMSDTNGRKPVGPSRGVGNGQTIGYGSPGAAPTTDPTEVEHEKFARELTKALERGRLDHAYESLIIAAPPQFLGLIRGLMGDPLARHVQLTIDKDFTNLDTRELATRIATATATATASASAS